MASPLHGMEVDAYAGVLMAFAAQSCAMSWEKEELLSDLRKELRISDDEHSEILANVKADESIKAVRRLHEGSYISQERIATWRNPFKKLKTTSVNAVPFAPTQVHASQTAYSSREGRLSAFRRGEQSLPVNPPRLWRADPGIIRIRDTAQVLHQVEGVFKIANADPAEKEKAMTMLKEQEQDLILAITRLEFAERNAASSE